ncbi:MAG: DUF4432 family protein, partial [Rectinemataceae bacterium]|nr:DUF4432 family protein [Rectinemataceae bacterium]
MGETSKGKSHPAISGGNGFAEGESGFEKKDSNRQTKEPLCGKQERNKTQVTENTRENENIERLVDASTLSGMAQLSFDAGQLRRGAPSRSSIGDFVVELGRADTDPDDVRRLIISSTDGFSLELLPTKGLSVGFFNTPNGQVFWNIPVTSLVSPEKIDLLGDMIIEGQRVKATRWLENFAGCIELLGLSNWGMPHRPQDCPIILPLHGEASQIPVEDCTIRANKSVLVARSTFVIRDHWWVSCDRDTPWYLRGPAKWSVTRHVVLDKGRQALQVLDVIKNLGDVPAVPDWGYHIQLRAEVGSRLSIPSRSRIDRLKGPVPEDFELWRPSPEPGKRFEQGYIHSGCVEVMNPFGQQAIRGSAIYERGPNTLFILPRSPYLQSWFSCGGAGGFVFNHPDRPNEPFMIRGWDGMG